MWRHGWRRAIGYWLLGTILGWAGIAFALFAFWHLMVWLGWWETAAVWLAQMVYFAADHYACPRV